MHEMSDMPGYRIREGDFRKAGEDISARPTSSIKTIAFWPSDARPEVDRLTNKYEVYIKFYDPPHYNITKFVGEGEKRKEVFVREGELDPAGILFEDNYQIEFAAHHPGKGETVHVTYLPKDYVSSEGCTSTPYNWKLFVTFYDKKPTSAEPSGQISNYQGQPQQREVTIPVRCKPRHEAGLLRCPTAKITERCECKSGDICEKNEYCNKIESAPDKSERKCQTAERVNCPKGVKLIDDNLKADKCFCGTADCKKGKVCNQYATEYKCEEHKRCLENTGDMGSWTPVPEDCMCGTKFCEADLSHMCGKVDGELTCTPRS
jgi:hypothetical protein